MSVAVAPPPLGQSLDGSRRAAPQVDAARAAGATLAAASKTATLNKVALAHATVEGVLAI
jgi:hypothetical protein